MSSELTASAPDTMRGTALEELRDRVAAGMRAEAEVEAKRCLPMRSKEAPASVDDFHPTIDELKVLARHWNRERWTLTLHEIYNQDCESCRRFYASCRINDIEDVIGEKAIQEVLEKVDAEVRKELGKEDWAAITGTDETAYERLIERVTWQNKCAEAWFKMNFASIRVNQLGSSEWRTYVFEITPASDMRIQITGFEDGKKTEGTLMLVSGVLLAKDLPLEPGYEIDAIDGPDLTRQLVNKLLAFGAGRSPSELSGHQTVNLTGKRMPIHVRTTSAEGTYPGPWSLAGSIESVSPKSVTFDLTFSVRFQGHGQKIRYAGRWEDRPTPLEIPDSLSLVGWKTFFLEPRRRPDGRGTTLDDSSRTSNESYATVGALREAVKS